MDNLTIVVSSCDKYEDIWNPFFALLKKNWNPDLPIVLITDSKSYSYPGLDIQTLQLFKPGERPTWSELQIKSLQAIKTDYILFILDDFFIEERVDESIIEQCLKWMDEDNEIAAFYLEPICEGQNFQSKYQGFDQLPQKGQYRLNCQVAIWRRETLIKDMRPHENPWVFETLGSRRSFRYKDQKFFCAASQTKMAVKYDYKAGGALNAGKWERHALDLLKQENIIVDDTLRGINSEVRGSSQRRRDYIFKNLSLKRIFNAIVTRWKSLKW